LNQPLVDTNVIPSHSLIGEVPLELFSTRLTVDRSDLLDSSDRSVRVGYDKARDSVFDNFRDGTLPIGNDRRAARQSFNHHNTERFRSSDREEQRSRISDELALRVMSNFADKLHKSMVQEGLDPLLKVSDV
jgi:hypothetical protein